ncbi:MAG: flagellar hook-basal body complex protein [Planctomycetes bacterium]|nr:flagellar hook-basal body complex protein [Planctomycetota bacterium]
MGLQSAMTTALTGLQAAETTIDVVGNNVANSGTTGFKESDVLFATQFLQTQSIGSAPSAERGGTNPRQIGLGVKVAAINPNFSQGTIEISANPLDVAIQGDGFLIVQGPQGSLYTRNGQIQTNSANELVTVTGNRLLGYAVDEDFNIVESGDPVPLIVPLGGAPVTQATQNAYFEGVLSSGAAVGTVPSIISSEVLGDQTYAFPTTDSLGGAFNSGDFQAVVAPDISGFTAATPNTGTLAAGDYRYRVTWYVDNGAGDLLESPASGIISVPGVAAGDEVQLGNLPVDGSPSPIWDGRNIYRSIDGSTFQLIGSIADVTTATFNDTGAAVPGAALDTTSLDQGNFSYYVTFVNGSDTTQESRPSARIGAIASGVDGRIRIDNLPQPTAPFTQIRIYRNLAGNSSEFHLVDTVDAGITTYIDNAPDAAISSNQQIDLMGVKANSGTFLTDVVLRDGDTYSTPFQEGVLSFTGKRGVGTLDAKQLTITSATTVQDLIDFMEQSFGIITSPDTPLLASAGGQINDGVIAFTSNAGEENALGVSLSALTITPTGGTSPLPIGISFTETQDENGQGSTSDFVAYDSLGTPINVRITTVMEEKTDTYTAYRWFATSGDNEPLTGVSTAVGTGTITFDGNGLIQGSPIATISIERNQSASESPLELNLDFSRVSGLDSRDGARLPITTMVMTRQDGFAPGTLSSFTITESGLISGTFSNGAVRPLGQIRMARFANNGGLQQVGENLFAQGVNSGEAVSGNPGESGIGTLTAGALELSNTDIGQNLIELILASTQYRGGARVITTAQQLLDELLSLRR